jgi:opacity protein-like surface antigen
MKVPHSRRAYAAIALGLGMAMASVTAAADEIRGFYFGVDGGIGSADINKSDLDRSLQAGFDDAELDVVVGNSNLDDRDFSYGAFIGYRFLPYLAAEVSYLGLGTAKYDADVTGPDLVAPVALTGKFMSDGPALSVLGIWPIGHSWDLYARGGIYFGSTTFDVRASTTDISSRDSSARNTQEFLWGIGAGYHVDTHWAVRLDFQEITNVGDPDVTGEANVDRLALGFVYSF